MPEWGVESREVWARDQLVKAKIPDVVASPALRLLKVWWEIRREPELVANILFIFSELAQDHALEVPELETTWVPVKPGQIRVTDIVRVKPNAFSGDVGQLHNGRLCRVVAIRSGDIIINSIDDGPKLDGTHYSPFSLDKQVIMT